MIISNLYYSSFRWLSRRNRVGLTYRRIFKLWWRERGVKCYAVYAPLFGLLPHRCPKNPSSCHYVRWTAKTSIQLSWRWISKFWSSNVRHKCSFEGYTAWRKAADRESLDYSLDKLFNLPPSNGKQRVLFVFTGEKTQHPDLYEDIVRTIEVLKCQNDCMLCLVCSLVGRNRIKWSTRKLRKI